MRLTTFLGLLLLYSLQEARAVNPGIVAKGLEAGVDVEKAAALAGKLQRADALAESLQSHIRFHEAWKLRRESEWTAQMNVPEKLRKDFFKLAEPDPSSSRELFKEFKADAARGEMSLEQAQISGMSIEPDGSVRAYIYAQDWSDSTKFDGLGRPRKNPGKPRRIGANIRGELHFKNLEEYNRYVAGSMYHVKQVLPQWMRFSPTGDAGLIKAEAERLMGTKYSGYGRPATLGPQIFIDPLGRVHVKYIWTPFGAKRLSRSEYKIFDNIHDYNLHVRADGKELSFSSPYRLGASDLKPWELSEQSKLLDETTRALDEAAHQ